MEHKLFDEVFELPNADYKAEYDNLVGLDQTKALLQKEGRLLLKPELLAEWSKKHHRVVIPAVDQFSRRPPLILFTGDVGTGKTALANSFGDSIAREEKIAITVFRLSLITRGRGAVGEMTTLISRSFDEVEAVATKGVSASSRAKRAVILVIDEADAIAESRSTDQMHHEDKAGVNALIRGVDRFTTKRLPVLVVLCTNRSAALDPAILRRAASVFEFVRPTEEQIAFILRRELEGAIQEADIPKIARMMLPNQERDYGFTFSDITQRVLPNLLLSAFPDQPISAPLAFKVIGSIEPTKPFSDE